MPCLEIHWMQKDRLSQNKLFQATHDRHNPRWEWFCINTNESSVFCIMEMFRSMKSVFESFGFEQKMTGNPDLQNIWLSNAYLSHKHSSHKSIVKANQDQTRSLYSINLVHHRNQTSRDSQHTLTWDFSQISHDTRS